MPKPHPPSERCLGSSKPVVLHVVEAFAKGVERHVVDLVRYIDSFEHVLAVPSWHKGESTSAAVAIVEKMSARVERVEMTRSRAAHRHVQALVSLRALIRDLRPDVIHGHSSIGGAMARVATIGHSTPLVYTPHALSRMGSAIVVERLLRGRADRVIAVSESERAFALGHKLAFERQIVVIPNGIELTLPSPLAPPLRSRLGIGDDVPLFGCAARLEWQKGADVFASACALCSERIPEAHFVLIGFGPLRDKVQRIAVEAGMQDRFHLIDSLVNASAGFVELDVYVLPSRFEGAPYTPMEAMRADTPVIVTDVAGNRDVVEDGVTGLMVPKDEPEALATAMVTLIEDRALRQRLVVGARRSLGRFSVDKMAAATEAVYDELHSR